jgi:undecaprenyl-diphosphatase
MSIIEAVVLGVVQGLTEFIPVSSSGHLIAGHELFGTTDSTLVFDVALHIGTLLALLLFFWKDLLSLTQYITAKTKQGRLARIIVVATLPAAILGYLGSDWIDDNLRRPMTVVITMAIMGLLMLLVEANAKKNKKLEDMNMKSGVSVGFAQALALIPGISRSGATITMGMIQGFTRADAAKFSFLLAVPITAGAIVGSLLGAESGELQGQNSVFAVGIVASLISGLFAIKFLMSFLSKNSLKVFAYYRLIFAGALLLVIL